MRNMKVRIWWNMQHNFHSHAFLGTVRHCSLCVPFQGKMTSYFIRTWPDLALPMPYNDFDPWTFDMWGPWWILHDNGFLGGRLYRNPPMAHNDIMANSSSMSKWTSTVSFRFSLQQTCWTCWICEGRLLKSKCRGILVPTSGHPMKWKWCAPLEIDVRRSGREDGHKQEVF